MAHNRLTFNELLSYGFKYGEPWADNRREFERELDRHSSHYDPNARDSSGYKRTQLYLNHSTPSGNAGAYGERASGYPSSRATFGSSYARDHEASHPGGSSGRYYSASDTTSNSAYRHHEHWPSTHNGYYYYYSRETPTDTTPSHNRTHMHTTAPTSLSPASVHQPSSSTHSRAASSSSSRSYTSSHMNSAFSGYREANHHYGYASSIASTDSHVPFSGTYDGYVSNLQAYYSADDSDDEHDSYSKFADTREEAELFDGDVYEAHSGFAHVEYIDDPADLGLSELYLGDEFEEEGLEGFDDAGEFGGEYEDQGYDDGGYEDNDDDDDDY
ncbi:hypothetical protein MIND_00776500 [Mycena indigotica]|uniref:Uncharacterized protein n=1 Tax=Mycena indigotica TaxID=2126181 RepID=A0A8H6SPP6_9AGAR|nr:uncharacterized protein MIND_00776500 [Mycena indigotica]KAF7302097.1 hypothetical protein MIND_00776500 [Mycena indigotica]